MATHRAQDPSQTRKNKTVTLAGAALIAGGLLLTPLGVSAMSPIASAKKFCPVVAGTAGVNGLNYGGSGHCGSDGRPGSDGSGSTGATTGMSTHDKSTAGCDHKKSTPDDTSSDAG